MQSVCAGGRFAGAARAIEAAKRSFGLGFHPPSGIRLLLRDVAARLRIAGCHQSSPSSGLVLSFFLGFRPERDVLSKRSRTTKREESSGVVLEDMFGRRWWWFGVIRHRVEDMRLF